MKSKAEVSRIPVPSGILKGDWYGVVYSIFTSFEPLDVHKDMVNFNVTKIVNEFDNSEHYTVSLMEVKRHLVFSDNNLKQYCTLVQFRVRDTG